MLLKTRYLTIAALIVLSFSNCKKDQKTSPGILTSKLWKRSLTDKNPSSNPPGSVLYEPVPDCEKDDTSKFADDGNLTLNRNTDKCHQNESQVSIQPYILNRTSKEFTINGTKFFLAEESGTQVKYYAVLSPITGYNYLVYLLE